MRILVVDDEAAIRLAIQRAGATVFSGDTTLATMKRQPAELAEWQDAKFLVRTEAEAHAIREVFADAPPPTVSIKSMIGHTMGAASALAAIGCSLAIDRGFIPPTVNHKNTDPEVGLDCVPNQARPADLRIVQNNAFAFGGNNAILILARPDGTQ